MSSQPFLGFVLLTHENPTQILRLIDRLNFMFDHPPIACHHDFNQCDLPREKVSPNVSFVMPPVKTAWGDWSLVEATVAGIRLLYGMEEKPEWFTLLSGSDYPLQPAGQIVNDLKNSPFDAHVASKKMVKSELRTIRERVWYRRYRSVRYQYPSWIHMIQSLRRGKLVKDDIIVKNEKYIRYLLPFTNKFVCYAGSHWLSANRKAAGYILEFHKSRPNVKRFYRKTPIPEESYFLTLLQNADHLNVSNKDWRYIDWTAYSPHPKLLTMEDLPRLVRANEHFARKFDIDVDDRILDQLDLKIGYRSSTKSVPLTDSA